MSCKIATDPEASELIKLSSTICLRDLGDDNTGDWNADSLLSVGTIVHFLPRPL